MNESLKIKAEAPHEPSATFLKHRRNLMLACFANLLIRYGETDFEKLNMAGLSIEFKSTNALSLLLFVALVYFFIRYFQFFLEIPEKGFAKPFSECLRRLCADDMEKLVCNQFSVRVAIEKFELSEKSWKTLFFTAEVFVNSKIQIGDMDGPSWQKLECIEIELDVVEYFSVVLRSFFFTVLKTTSATNYYLQFLVFFFTFSYIVFCQLA